MTIEPNQRAHAAKRVIAVVTDAFAPFHRNVLDGLRPHFSAAGFGTLGVAGRDVRTDRLLGASGARHSDYRGAFGTQLDVQGAIVVCGATSPTMSDEAIAAYVAALTSGPVVSLGIALPNVPSVELDWPTGIGALMHHVLSLERPARSFAFVRGFPGDPHSKMREAGFRSALETAGVPIDERLIVNGNFSVADAYNAVGQLLTDGRAFDSLIAANDDMAVGALAALRSHGLSVPGDVVVAGFDDALSAVTSDPPLTTVLLDTSELTRRSATLLLDAVRTHRNPPPDLIVEIDTELVVRASTGRVVPQAAASRAEALAQRFDRRRAPMDVDVDQLATFAVAATSGDTRFGERLEELCQHADRSTGRATTTWLRHIWREIHESLPEIFPGEQEALHLLKDLAAVDQALHPIERRHDIERTTHRQLQERLVMRLASCSDTAALWNVLRSGLRSLGMVNAWVVANRIEAQGESQTAEHPMQLIFSLQDDDVAMTEPFHPAEVLPPPFSSILEHDIHVLVPLRAGESDIGYMVVEPSGEFLLELEAIASGVAQVLRHVRQVKDLEGQAERLRMANEALDRLARRDDLTGLANRKMFLERLEAVLSEAGQTEHLAVVFIDLDGFKRINDTLGHAAGDQLLRIIADRLGELTAPSDLLARLGGDEFTIIVRDATDPLRVLDVAQRALEAAAKPSLLAGHEVSVSASLGVASFPDDGATASELLRNADAAMYAAKRAGRNRVEIYCES